MFRKKSPEIELVKLPSSFLSSAAKVNSQLISVEIKSIKKPVHIGSRPLIVIPSPVKLKHVDQTGRLIIPNENYVVKLIAKKLLEEKKDPIKQGIIYKKDHSKLKYDVIYKDKFIGHIYSVDVGEGAYGVVKLLYAESKWYAIKIINSKDTHEEVQCLQKTGLALFAIEDRDKKLIVMEYMPGINLGTFIHSDPLVPPQTWYKITKSLFNCVINLHEDHLIIHNDIKPMNFILQGQYDVKLIDYGVSFEVSKDSTLITNERMSTPQYMASEFLDKAQKDNLCGIKTDEFSLAISIAEIYQLLLPNFANAHPVRQFSWGNNQRLITNSNSECKNNFRVKTSEREELLQLLNDMTAKKSSDRPALRLCLSRLDNIFKNSHTHPIVKAMVDLDELNLLVTADKTSKLTTFLQALKMVDLVILIENKKHNLIEQSKVVRFLTFQKGKKSELKFSGINLLSEIYFPEEKATILEVAAGVPEKDALVRKEDDSYFIFLTTIKHRIKTLASHQVTILHPKEVLQLSGKKGLEQDNANLFEFKNTFFSKLNSIQRASILSGPKTLNNSRLL